MTFDKEEHRAMIKELINTMRVAPNPLAFRAVAELMEAIEASTIEIGTPAPTANKKR